MIQASWLEPGSPASLVNEWYTPGRYVKAAHEVMGGIDLDPASSELANMTVKAARYYTSEQNGLLYPWHGRVWLNPPYSALKQETGRTGSREGYAKPFIRKLIREYERGNVTEAILLVVSDTDAGWFQWLYDFLICFADHKIRFNRPGRASEGQFFGSCFVYFGEHEQRFIDVFSSIGTVVKRVSPLREIPRQASFID